MPVMSVSPSDRNRGDRYSLPEMTPQRRKERTLAELLAQLRRLATQQPILMVFEDLHWIDPTSLELLSRVIEEIGDQATARPEFTPPWPNHRHISTLSLNRLGDRKERGNERHVLWQIAARLLQQGFELVELGLGAVVALDTGRASELADEGIERATLMQG
jgi:predicted ATPase